MKRPVSVGGNVSMSARLVESFRGAWSPMDESFTDHGIAIDFVRHLEPTHGPTVVRVTVDGGAPRLAGDWLCDVGHRLGKNTRLASPRWDFSRSAAAWSRTKYLIDAWETCAEPEWLAWTAENGNGMARKLVVSAAVACARVALSRAYGGDADGHAPGDSDLGSAMQSLSAAERFVSSPGSSSAYRAWSQGRLTAARSYAASEAQEHRRQHAIEAAGLAAQLCSASERVDLVDVVRAAWSAVGGDGSVIADAVRSAIGTIDYLRAVAKRSR